LNRAREGAGQALALRADDRPSVPLSTLIVPALVADLGHTASWRFIEFFTANIRNPHTRRAYARACRRFFRWCDTRGLTLAGIRPFDVAAWVEALQQDHSAPGVKQQLAAVRMLFDWARHRPDRADEPGCRRARPEARREDG
jgi:site-specific recombinase XerD